MKQFVDMQALGEQIDKAGFELNDNFAVEWKNCIFELCGVKNFYRKTYSVVVTSTVEERVAWLRDVTETVNRYFSSQVEI